MSDVPLGIILEILLRLPVKSLCRFRCVSKPWRILISDPDFVEKHLDLVKKHEPLESMMYIIQYTCFDLKSCTLFSLVHDPFGSAVELYHPDKNLRNHMIIIGSCNGLVCFCLIKTTSIDMFIWNPSTRESKSCPFPFSEGIFRFSEYVQGFYYDRTADDYIVVIVDGRISKSRVEIYSLKTNSWRRIDHIDSNHLSCASTGGSGKLVNGALHWKGRPLFIIALDLAGSQFREVPKPQPTNYGYGLTSMHVQVIGESLSIFSNRYGHSVDVWIMKEYGVKESWTKFFSLPYTLEMTNFFCGGARCTSKYIMIFSSGRLALYDLDHKTLTYPLIVDYRWNSEVRVFMETLVSPNAYG